MNGVNKKKGFDNSYKAARSTTSGKAFTKALKSQKHYDVVYFELKGTTNSGVSTVLNSENDDVRKTLRNPNVSSGLSPEPFDDYFMGSYKSENAETQYGQAAF